MWWRRGSGYGPIQRALAWSGLILMAVCFVMMQLLPMPTRWGATSNRPRAQDDAQIPLLILDPGHGGRDSGAIRGGVSEKDLTLDVALRVAREAHASGMETILTRASDEWVSLASRAARANDERDCIFVSIHFDHGKRAAATGIGTYYAAQQASKRPLLPSWLPFLQRMSSETNVESQSLAGFVQDALVTRTQAFNRGTKAEQFFVIANVVHPAVLVEGGFLSNDEDMSKLASEVYRQQIATAITEGILRYRDVLRRRQSTLATGQPGT